MTEVRFEPRFLIDETHSTRREARMAELRCKLNQRRLCGQMSFRHVSRNGGFGVSNRMADNALRSVHAKCGCSRGYTIGASIHFVRQSIDLAAVHFHFDFPLCDLSLKPFLASSDELLGLLNT